MVDLEQLFTAESSRRNILQSTMTVKAHQHQLNGITNGDVDDTVTTNGHNGVIDEPALDIDMFEQSPAATRIQPHKFGQMQISRGERQPASSEMRTEMDRDGGAISRGFRSQLAFPCLSSFPNIFGNTGEGDNLEIKASFAASTTVSRKLKGYAEQARILPSDEREDMSSDFRTWADEYVDGYESEDEDWDE